MARRRAKPDAAQKLTPSARAPRRETAGSRGTPPEKPPALLLGVSPLTRAARHQPGAGRCCPWVCAWALHSGAVFRSVICGLEQVHLPL